jgi:YHS domain-containing protein
VSFVYADLIAAPLLLIYRRFYGTRLTQKLLAVFWATMSVTGLAVEAVFRAVGAVPPHARHAHVGTGVWRLDATTGLDLAALAVLVALYLLYRRRGSAAGGSSYARDPICGMQVERAQPGAVTRWRGVAVYFCSERCRARFLAEPTRYADAVGSAESVG